MADNDTINWNKKTITIRDNIKFIHITINHYPDSISTHIYSSSKTKTKTKNSLETFYNWKKVIEYWNKNILEYNKIFNIEFDKFTLGDDYSLVPIYINNDNYCIGIFILNTSIIKSLKDKPSSYSFLSRIEPYKYKKDINKFNSDKYNFFNGILSNNNNNQYFKNKEFIINNNTNLDTNLETKINIPIKYILQNSMNYLPKLEINRIKMSSQNLLNP